MSSQPSPLETARSYLQRTPHEFVARQGNPAGQVPGSCACGRHRSDPVHSGTALLATYAYLSRLTAVLNELDDGPEDPVDMPATAGMPRSQNTDG